MFNAIVVEDNPNASKLLTSFLTNFFAEDKRCSDLALNVIVYSSSEDFLKAYVPEAVVTKINASETHPYPDLIFMDIDFKEDLNGLDTSFLFRDSYQHVPLVFVTNLAQYAIRGYDVDALDFLVKPVTYDAFKRSMEKVFRNLSYRERKTISVGTGNKIDKIALSDIVYIDVLNHNLTYHLKNSGNVELRGSLKDVEELLSGSPFVRISNNCLVNMDAIDKIHGGELVVLGGDVLYFSRSRRRDAVGKITNYLAGGQ